MLVARARMRMQLLRHQGEFADQASGAILSDLPNRPGGLAFCPLNPLGPGLGFESRRE